MVECGECAHLKEKIASAALVIFASAARLRRKGDINESQVLEKLAVELHGIVRKEEGEPQ